MNAILKKCNVKSFHIKYLLLSHESYILVG